MSVSDVGKSNHLTLDYPLVRFEVNFSQSGGSAVRISVTSSGFATRTSALHSEFVFFQNEAVAMNVIDHKIDHFAILSGEGDLRADADAIRC